MLLMGPGVFHTRDCDAQPVRNAFLCKLLNSASHPCDPGNNVSLCAKRSFWIKLNILWRDELRGHVNLQQTRRLWRKAKESPFQSRHYLLRGICAITNINPHFFTDRAKRRGKGGLTTTWYCLTLCVSKRGLLSRLRLADDPLGFLEGFLSAKELKDGEHILESPSTEGIWSWWDSLNQEFPYAWIL